MRRICLTLGVFAFCCVFCAPVQAGPLRDWWQKRHPKPAVRVEKKIEVDRERKVLRVRPVGCQGQCPVR